MSESNSGYTFDIDLLQAISDWQCGGDVRQNKRRGLALKQACASLPEKYKTCLLVCHRQIALPNDGVWSLIGENWLPEKISSWTLDLEVAKKFKNGVPPAGQGYQGVIFSMYPPPDSVIVSLRELYKDEAFLEAMESNKSRIDRYYDGAGRYQGEQFEVVLEINAVTPEDIFSLGGHSSPLDKLVEQAANLVYRRPATQEEKDALLLTANRAEIKTGPSWLNIDATRRVLARTKPKAEALAKIKKLQSK